MSNKRKFQRTKNGMKLILSLCDLEQHYNYLSQNGFNSIESLTLLNTSDFNLLPNISFGHMKIIVKTAQEYIQKNSIITAKYEQYLKQLKQLETPSNLFRHIDKKYAAYQKIKQKYVQQWSKYPHLHQKLSNSLKTPSTSESNLISIIVEIEPFLIQMRNLTDSLNEWNANMNGESDTFSNIATCSNTKPLIHINDESETKQITLDSNAILHSQTLNENKTHGDDNSRFKYHNIPHKDCEETETETHTVNSDNTQLCREFIGSTHYYLIYVQDPENDNNKSIDLALLGFMCLMVQFILNYIILIDGFEALRKDAVPVMINFYDCGWDDDQVLEPHLLRCTITRNDRAFVALAMILSSVFLQYDYFACIKIILLEPNIWSRVAACLILLESMVTTFACCLYAYQGWYNSEGADVIMNTVGILFIHDLDEKLYEALSVISAKKLILYVTPKEHSRVSNIFGR
eukprot:140304_1